MTIMTIRAGTAATQPPRAYKTNRKMRMNGRSANVTSVADAITSLRESNSFTTVAILPIGLFL